MASKDRPSYLRDDHSPLDMQLLLSFAVRLRGSSEGPAGLRALPSGALTTGQVAEDGSLIKQIRLTLPGRRYPSDLGG